MYNIIPCLFSEAESCAKFVSYYNVVSLKVVFCIVLATEFHAPSSSSLGAKIVLSGKISYLLVYMLDWLSLLVGPHIDNTMQLCMYFPGCREQEQDYNTLSNSNLLNILPSHTNTPPVSIVHASFPPAFQPLISCFHTGYWQWHPTCCCWIVQCHRATAHGQ